MPVKQIQPLPDPAGMISRIKSRLPKNCAVKNSPFCEVIISMRMQGVDYRTIEAWLTEQGPEYRISSPTIWRNLKNTKLQVELPYAEEIAEKWGGRIDLDLARELSGQIVAQRARVDNLQRKEVEKQQSGQPHYHDKRIVKERMALADLVKSLHAMMKSPLDAAREAIAADQLGKAVQPQLTSDGEAKIRQMILDGSLRLGDLAPHG